MKGGVRDIARSKMSKRVEKFKACANALIVLALIGIVICCLAKNEIVGYFGIVLIAVGFLGAISADSIAEICISEKIKDDEKRLKEVMGQLDVVRGVNYTFIEFLADNGCTLEEFIHIHDELNLNIDYVYEQYEISAGDDVIQTRQQVSDIIWLERNRTHETAKQANA